VKTTRHSPSSLNLFCASPSMFVLERILGQRQPVGAPAHRGTAVEAGITLGLMDPKASLEACAAEAEKVFDQKMALSGDPRKDTYRATIAEMVNRGLEELRPYGTPTSTQGFVEWKPEGLEYPIVGYYDFEFGDHGIVVDLKTTERMPSEVKPAHARQVALYAAAISDNVEGRLTYLTPKKHTTYRLENSRQHREALHKIALTVERFLALSDDPQFFVGITAPDFESFYWTNPRARQAGFETWGI
jgi:CRISPR/Cas system-associated exonuclease Cas4 (RecB family)